jgi:hypothetical protein
MVDTTHRCRENDHGPSQRCARRAFDDLWERGELDPTTRLLRDDVVWVNDIGAGPFHRGPGKESFVTLFAEWTALFDGGFAHELVDIGASDHNVVEILHEVGTARASASTTWPSTARARRQRSRHPFRHLRPRPCSDRRVLDRRRNPPRRKDAR